MDCYPKRRRLMELALEEVAGGVQFFRRECFELVGGILPIPEGGFDVIMCVQVRMHGYKTKTFAEIEVDHLKPRNVAEGNVCRRLWQFGLRDYARGNHPLFEFVKCAHRCLRAPVIIGGFIHFSGFLWCYLTRRKRIPSTELIHFMRGEQLARLFLRKQAQLSSVRPAQKIALS